jgi:hypothetical protein
VYENLGENQKAQEDYKTAKELLRPEDLKRIEEVKSYKNYYKDFYNKKKIQYGFDK